MSKAMNDRLAEFASEVTGRPLRDALIKTSDVLALLNEAGR